MLRNKKKTLIAVLLCVAMSTCAAAPAAGDEKGKPVEETNTGLTIQKEKPSDLLYTDALNQKVTDTQKFTTVRRGDFIVSNNISATVVYPKQKRIRYDFPYGDTYFIEVVGAETPNKVSGDPIAKIYVAVNQIQLAELERRLQRMEERGEYGSQYEELQKQFVELQDALVTTEIVMEDDGVVLQQQSHRQGTRITSYEITVGDPKERLLEVPNEKNLFRYGQKVKVTGKIKGVPYTGTGTVITASRGTVSEGLAGTTAQIRLDEDSEFLYDGNNFQVTVESVHMEDVLLVDASAVYMDNGVQMVKIKDEYGLHAVSFSFGRVNESTYWVIDGLEEGAQILVQ